MDTIKPLFTAAATATGGRNGHTQANDGLVQADLSVPKEMGGPGKPNTTTPEHLFAAGYAACMATIGPSTFKWKISSKITGSISSTAAA
jgi:organic hydroperoxide reductase OsmC/OhrA